MPSEAAGDPLVGQIVGSFRLARLHFRAEQQILASLGHPDIVQLIDGGITTAGGATDIYSAGVLVYIRAHPFESVRDQPVRLMGAPLSDPPPHAKDVPADLDSIVLKSLRKEPELRYTSAAQCAGDPAPSNPASSNPKPTSKPTEQSRARRKRLLYPC